MPAFNRMDFDATGESNRMKVRLLGNYVDPDARYVSKSVS